MEENEVTKGEDTRRHRGTSESRPRSVAFVQDDSDCDISAAQSEYQVSSCDSDGLSLSSLDGLKKEKAFVSPTHRDRIIHELISTEKSYYKGLDTLVHFIAPAFHKSGLIQKDIGVIFPSSVFLLHDYHRNLLRAFSQYFTISLFARKQSTHSVDWLSQQSNGTNQSGTLVPSEDVSTNPSPPELLLIAITQNGGEMLRTYQQFFVDFPIAVETLSRNTKSSSKVAKIIRELQSDSRCAGLEPSAFLLTPVQRIPRLLLLIKQLHSHSPSDHPDIPALTELKKQLETFLDVVEVSLKIALEAPEKKKKRTRRLGFFTSGSVDSLHMTGVVERAPVYSFFPFPSSTNQIHATDNSNQSQYSYQQHPSRHAVSGAKAVAKKQKSVQPPQPTPLAGGFTNGHHWQQHYVTLRAVKERHQNPTRVPTFNPWQVPRSKVVRPDNIPPSSHPLHSQNQTSSHTTPTSSQSHPVSSQPKSMPSDNIPTPSQPKSMPPDNTPTPSQSISTAPDHTPTPSQSTPTPSHPAVNPPQPTSSTNNLPPRSRNSISVASPGNPGTLRYIEPPTPPPPSLTLLPSPSVISQSRPPVFRLGDSVPVTLIESDDSVFMEKNPPSQESRKRNSQKHQTKQPLRRQVSSSSSSSTTSTSSSMTSSSSSEEEQRQKPTLRSSSGRSGSCIQLSNYAEKPSDQSDYDAYIRQKPPAKSKQSIRTSDIWDGNQPITSLQGESNQQINSLQTNQTPVHQKEALNAEVGEDRHWQRIYVSKASTESLSDRSSSPYTRFPLSVDSFPPEDPPLPRHLQTPAQRSSNTHRPVEPSVDTIENAEDPSRILPKDSMKNVFQMRRKITDGNLKIHEGESDISRAERILPKDSMKKVFQMRYKPNHQNNTSHKN